eukprot:scaffold28_cov515-Prasinococcus_capsulatus_cf.AAC.19
MHASQLRHPKGVARLRTSRTCLCVPLRFSPKSARAFALAGGGAQQRIRFSAWCPSRFYCSKY